MGLRLRPGLALDHRKKQKDQKGRDRREL